MMAGMKSLFQKPKWRTLLFVSFVLLFYFTRTRLADPIGDLQLDGNFGFMAVGKAGIVVLDFSDPENPMSISEYDTLGYANAVLVGENQVFVADDSNGLLILSKEDLLNRNTEEILLANYRTPNKAIDVAVKGNFAYIVDSGGDIWIVNINKLLNNSNTDNGVEQEISGKAEQIQIHGNRAYITTKKDQLLIYTLDDPNTLDNPGIYDVGASIRNFIIVGNEYAYLAADTKGLVILNIGNPSEISLEKEFGDVSDAQDVALRGNYAYIASGEKGFFVLDIADNFSITQVGHEPSPANAHLIRVKDDYVYLADDRDGLKTFQSSVQFEYSEKEETSNLGSFESVIVKDDYAFVAAGEDGLRVINVKDPTAPIGVYLDDEVEGYASALDTKEDYLYVLYRKKGLRIFSVFGSSEAPKPDNEKDTPGEANDLAVKGEFVYIADGPAGLQIVDLRNYAKPEIYSEDTPGNALGVFVLDDYAYIADGGEGLQIILVSDPEKPTLIHEVETPGEARSVFVSKIRNSADEERTYAFIADGGAGLYIVDVTVPDQPVDVATYAVKNYASDVIIQNQTAYLAERDDGLVLLDISNIIEPTLIKNQPTPGAALGIYVQENLGYVADGKRGLRIIDFSDTEKIQEIGFFDVPKKVKAIVAQKPNGYMVDGENGMWVMDLANPESPYSAAFYSTPGNSNAIKVNGTYAYIADGSSGLQVVDISKSFAPVKGGSFEDIENAISIAIENEFAYVGSTDKNLHILKISDLANITEVLEYKIKAEPKDIDVLDGYAYIAQGENGLEVINVKDPEDPSSVFISEDLGLMDTQAVLVLGSHDHLFVADGKNGMKIFNIDKPARPIEVFHFELQNENGNARSVTIENEYAFLAVENEAIYQFHILDLNRISVVGRTPIDQAQSIAAISSSPGNKNIKRFFNYIAVGEQGLKTFEVTGEAGIQAKGIYETAGEATLSQVFRSVFVRLMTSLDENPIPIPDKVWARIAYIVFGLFVFIFLSSMWLILFAQFVLPVQTFKGGGKATSRLYQSLWGNQGPAVFAKDGSLVARPGELQRRGRGVARVDLNSAIVLERRAMVQSKRRRYYKKMMDREVRRGITIPRSRVEGPGVVFIKPYETIRGVADLRSQFRIRPGVQAYTRDGIEVNNPVWILFTLGQPPAVLDVAYDGARSPENLRVIKFEDELIGTEAGKERKGKLVKDLSDELDKSDKDEIHLFIQKNILVEYFLRVKALSQKLESNGDLGEVLTDYVDRIKLLATRLDLDGRESVKKFFEDLNKFFDLSEKDEVIDIPTIKWFAYQIGARADHYAFVGMTAFYEIIYQIKFNQYIQEIRAMQFPKDLVEYAQQRMEQCIKQTKENDENREFILNAVRVKNIIDREINRDIEILTNDEIDQIKKEQLIAFQEKITFITDELSRTDYPFTEIYSSVAKLSDCVSKMNRVASQITIEEEWQFPNKGDLFRIRKSIGNLQRELADQEKAFKSEFKRYVDLVKIHDYVEFVRRKLEELRLSQLENEHAQDLDKVVELIQKKAKVLNLVTDSAFRKPVKKLKEITHELEGKDTSEVFFFVKNVENIWRKTRSADILVVRSFLRKSQQQFGKIRGNILRLSSLISARVVNGEVQKYQEQISQILTELENCQIPERLLYKSAPKQENVGPYLFDRKRVLAAVYSEALDLDRVEGEAEHMPWTNLPVHVAAQTFRDMVSREQYDYLYQPKDPNKFNIPILKGNFSREVRNQGVLAFRFVDHIDGLPLKPGDELEPEQLLYYKNRELKNPKVLRARGIKVIASGFPDLFPVSEGVPSHQLDHWSAPWQRVSKEIRSQHELQAIRVINQERAKAQKEMAYNLANILQTSPSDEALAMRVFQALEETASGEEIRQFLPGDVTYLLQSFKEWFTKGLSFPGSTSPPPSTPPPKQDPTEPPRPSLNTSEDTWSTDDG